MAKMAISLRALAFKPALGRRIVVSKSAAEAVFRPALSVFSVFSQVGLSFQLVSYMDPAPFPWSFIAFGFEAFLF